MKLLFITEYYPTSPDTITGGVEARMWYVTRELAKRHAVTVIASHQPGMKRQENIGRVTVYRVGLSYSYTAGGGVVQRLMFMVAAMKKGKAAQCDLVEGSTVLTHLVAWHVAQYHRAPAIAWIADVWDRDWFRWFGPANLLGWLLETYSLSHPWARFLPISHVVAKKLLRRGISKKNIHVIPCGIDPSEFPKRKVRKNPYLLVWAGRFINYKRPFVFLRAFQRLHRAMPQLRAIMIGHGQLEQEIKTYIAENDLVDAVTVESNISRRQFIQHLSHAAVFVQTSVFEGFGIVVLEALAAKTPVIAPDLPIYHETTQNHGTLFFPANDIEALIHRVKQLLIDERLMYQLARDGYKHTRQLTWARIAKKTEKIFKESFNSTAHHS